MLLATVLARGTHRGSDSPASLSDQERRRQQRAGEALCRPETGVWVWSHLASFATEPVLPVNLGSPSAEPRGGDDRQAGGFSPLQNPKLFLTPVVLSMEVWESRMPPSNVGVEHHVLLL